MLLGIILKRRRTSFCMVGLGRLKLRFFDKPSNLSQNIAFAESPLTPKDSVASIIESSVKLLNLTACTK